MPSPKEFTRSSAWLLGMALFALALCVYAPSLRNGFIWDDNVFLTENTLIKASDGLYRFWFTREPPDYFPLTSSMLWVEWRVFGAQAAGYHVINVLLHATSCVVLWRVLSRLSIPGAWLAAALFAVHPVNVETVSWITERKNTLPMVFALAALLMYLRDEDEPEGTPHRRAWYAASLVAFLLALLSKTSVVMLPCILLTCAWWRRGVNSKSDVLRATPYFALSFALGLVTVWYQTYSAIGDDVVRTDGFVSRSAIAGRAVWFYLYKALCPLNLSFVYPRWQADLAWWGTYVPLAALIACCALLVRMRESWGRPLLFASSCYVLTLLPVLGFVDIYFMRYSLVADHWQYTAIAAVLALVAAAWTDATSRWGMIDAGRFAAGLVVVLLAALSWRQQRIYRDVESLWTDTLAKNPGAWIAHNNLGLELRHQGRVQEAMAHFESAIELEPTFAGAHNNLGAILQDQGRSDEAVMHCERALQLDPNYVEAHNNLGIALAELGRLDEAQLHYERALALNPNYASAHGNLASALQSLGHTDAALEEYAVALRLEPDLVEVRYNLGNLLQTLGRFGDAASAYNQALQRAPDHVVVLCRLAWLLATSSDRNVRDVPHALELAQSAIRITGGRSALAQSTLAVARAGDGDFKEATASQERALALASPAEEPEARQRLDAYRRAALARGTHDRP